MHSSFYLDQLYSVDGEQQTKTLYFLEGTQMMSREKGPSSSFFFLGSLRFEKFIRIIFDFPGAFEITIE